MVVENSHFQVAKYLTVQLDVSDQDEFYVVSFLRLSPDVVSVINTPEIIKSQMQIENCLVKSKNYNPSIAETVVSNNPIVSSSVPPPA